jgi:hypothetical protein
MVPLTPIFIGVTFVFTFHMKCTSIVRPLYLKIHQASFLIKFVSPGIAIIVIIKSFANIMLHIILIQNSSFSGLKTSSALYNIGP